MKYRWHNQHNIFTVQYVVALKKVSVLLVLFALFLIDCSKICHTLSIMCVGSLSLFYFILYCRMVSHIRFRKIK